MSDENRARVAAALCLVALSAVLVAETLFAGRTFAFRDASHFYYPLFELVHAEWAAGRVPLWNPYANGGAPLLASATASALYPGKLVFLLPVSHGTAYSIYLVAHLLLAAGAAWFAARRFGASAAAAGIAALSYFFCGNVLFLSSNAVFLCGAAWMPLAFAAAHRAIDGRDPRAAIALAAVLAMMVLAGDPQAAYHAGLAAALFAALSWRAERRAGPGAPPPRKPGRRAARERASYAAVPLSRRWLRGRLALLALAAATAAALAAVQVFPTLAFSRGSDRARAAAPRSLFELVVSGTRSDAASGGTSHWSDGLVGRTAESDLHEIYGFSVGPWRLPEYLWPNWGGRALPEHRRWLAAVPGDGGTQRLWVPSLYMGLLPLALAIGRLRPLRGAPRTRWLALLSLSCVVGSFGRFGLGWLLGAESVAPQVGGLYWLGVVALPGYVQFRYPAKLLAVAALALSLLAAEGFDQARTDRFRGLRRLLAVLGIASAAAAGAAWLLRAQWSAWLAGAAPDPYFGPLDAGGAHADLLGAFAQTALLAGLLSALLGLAARPERGAVHAAAARWLAPLCLALTALDLGVANRWMLVTAPVAELEARSEIARVLERDRAARGREGSASPHRLFRLEPPLPEAWSQTSSETRVTEILRRERDTLASNHPLGERLAMVESTGTLRLFDYGLFFARGARRSPDGLEYVQPRRALDAWNARYLIVPERGRATDPQRSTLGLERRWGPADGPDAVAPSGLPLPAIPAGVAGVELRTNADHLPRAWIVHDVRRIAPIPHADVAARRRLVSQLVAPGRAELDLRRTAVVESDTALRAAPASGPAPQRESVRIVRYAPQRVELEAALREPGLVVLSDVHDPGWRLEVRRDGDRERVPILRTNLLMRGAFLSAGAHHLVFSYAPRSFRVGAVVSILAGSVLLAGARPLVRARSLRLAGRPGGQRGRCASAGGK